jgi:High potential iron-sulfur protein
MKTDRRIFVIRSTVGLAAMLSAPLVLAMAGPVTDEKDPKAEALGYKRDAATVDTAKYPAYAAGQSCGSCSNFKGSPGIAAGPCPRMPKPVLAAGWCSGYAKKS